MSATPATVSPGNFLISFRDYLLLGLLLAFTAFMLMFRRPDLFSNAQFWAEDAKVFFLGDYTLGWRALFEPYVGYIHLIPRVVAFIGGLFVSNAYLPLFYNSAFFFLVLSTVVYVGYKCGSNKVVFALMVLSLTLLPLGWEPYTGITNIQWWLGLALLLPIAFPALNKRDIRMDAIIVFLIGLTGPFSLIFLPVAFVIYCCRLKEFRNQWSVQLPFLIFFFCAGVQCIILLNNMQTRGAGLLEFSDAFAHFPRLYYQLFTHLTYNMKWVDEPPVALAFSFNTVLIVGTLVLFIFSVRLLRDNDFAPFTFLIAAFLMLFTLLAMNNPLLLHPILSGQRYFFIPCVAVFWSLLSLVRARTFQLIYFVALASFLIFRNSTYQQLVLQDLKWNDYASRIGHEKLEIPINPDWTIEVPAKK